VATRIRLARGGKKKHPYYRIVVADSRARRDGKFIERIGSYDPLLKENKVTLDLERARHWLNVGALPSERVARLMAVQGLEHKLVVVRRRVVPAQGGPKAKGKRRAARPDAAAGGAEPAS